MITSLLLVLSIGLGLTTLQKYIIKPTYIILIVGFFIIITIYYPIGEHWQQFTTRSKNTQTNYSSLIPTPPIKRHLTQEDIELFKNIQNSIFITPPWKGLVLATYTSNDPLESKASIIRAYILPYKEFINMNCIEKTRIITEYNVSYAYSADIDCPNFKYIGQSTEGLKLYQISNSY
jgi:hypothetical protein